MPGAEIAPSWHNHNSHGHSVAMSVSKGPAEEFQVCVQVTLTTLVTAPTCQRGREGVWTGEAQPARLGDTGGNGVPGGYGTTHDFRHQPLNEQQKQEGEINPNMFTGAL